MSVNEGRSIRRVAVLGAGVMGAQIAAHFANAHVPVILYELKSQEGQANDLVNKSLAMLQKLKPAPLSEAEKASLITAANYDDDLPHLTECQLIIEAVAERLDIKEQLFNKIGPFVSPRSILASNTSGLSINQLATTVPEKLRPQFCGIHFFNPPRYMHLVELIPHATTNAGILEPLEAFLTRRLGKGVVFAKDTPNFIANRVGVFSMLSIIQRADEFSISPDVVDALTGGAIGRAKSATFRTADVVGLDTFGHVVNTMAEGLRDDPWHSVYTLPSWIKQLIDNGALGQKSKAGIYKKEGRKIHVWDTKTNEYRLSDGTISDEVAQILKEKSPTKRFDDLVNSSHPEAKFLSSHMLDIFQYVACHLESIADNARDVDLALRWGFGWQQGPFETWQSIGWQAVTKDLTSFIRDKRALATANLPDWVSEFTDAKAVYTDGGAYSPKSKTYTERFTGGVYKRQLYPDPVLAEPRKSRETLYENEGVALWRLESQPNIGVISFKTKMHTVHKHVLDGIQSAIHHAEDHLDGVVIWQDTTPFSAGANLQLVSEAVAAGQFDELTSIVANFQKTSQVIRYANVPVVAAVQGLALGGGCEFILHCDHVVAALESYIGLVEVGVGLVPAGAGCKEFARRLSNQFSSINAVKAYGNLLELIGTAKVSTSADNAKTLGYLRETDSVIMNSHELLYVALEKADSIAKANYRSPIKSPIIAAGRDLWGTLQAQLTNWIEGGFISEHDYLITNHVAEIICGGDVAAGTPLDEDWYLTLERDAFMSLMKTKPTQERIAHMLKTGKPLRN